MTENADPIRVKLTVADWMHVPAREYTKTLEFDREDWDDMTPMAREQEIEEQLRDFCLNTFSREYDIENGDLNDPVSG
jgi:hypothetical protein